MPWGRIDDRAHRCEKFLALSDAAFRLYWAAVSYVAEELTDGFVADYKLPAFGVRGNVSKAAAELCRAIVPGKGPLFHKVDGGYQVHDYLHWNDSAEKITANRESARKRMAANRSAECSREQNQCSREHHTEQVDLFARTSRRTSPLFGGVFGAVPLIHILKNEDRTCVSTCTDLTNSSTPPKTAERSEESFKRNAIRRMVATCHQVVATTTYTDRPSIVEAFKTACARQRLPYGDRSITPNGQMPWVYVFEHVERQRARKRQRRAS
jgi:hypothetical protein